MSASKCSWCGSPFILIGSHYWCESPACRERQSNHAIALQDSEGKWLYLYVPLPKQVDFDCAPVRYLLGGGAAGVSKSHGGRWSLYRRCLAIPGFEALILRNTWEELDKHHLRLMDAEANVFRSKGVDAQYFSTSREIRFTHADGTQSIIEGGHMDDPKHLQKYLSRERDAILADEGVNFQPRQLLELSTRARSTKPAVRDFARRYVYTDLPPDKPVPGGGATFWVLSNPGGPSAKMLRELFIDHEPDWDEYDPVFKQRYNPSLWGYVPGNLEDNPYLPEDYEADLSVLQPWRYQQLRHNNWDIVAGQFFSEFRASTHVADLGDPGDNVEWFRSMDWGFVQPGCCLWWACLPDGILYVRYEWKFSLTNIPDVAEEVKNRTLDAGIHASSIRYTVIDPSTKAKYGDSGESIIETFVRPPSSLPVIPGDNNRFNGWQRIRELLRLRPDGRPTMVVHPDCRYLIRSFSAAVSDRNNPDDINTHSDDHALDTARYGAMSRPSPTRVSVKTSSKTFNAHKERVMKHRKRLMVRR